MIFYPSKRAFGLTTLEKLCIEKDRDIIGLRIKYSSDSKLKYSSAE